MKKFLLFSLMVIVTLVGVFGLLYQKASRMHATALVPEDASLFIHLPDLRKSCNRWTKTALYQILQEPEVCEFLEKPKTQSHHIGRLRACWEDFLQTNPQEAFFAIGNAKTQAPTAGNLPPFVAGALLMGDKAKVETLLSRAGREFQNTDPEGQRTTSYHQGVSIETTGHGDVTLSQAWVGRWFFVANQIELIKQCIERALPHRGLASIQASTDFRQCMDRMPKNADLIAFARPSVALELQGKATAWSGFAAAKNIKALSLGLKMEGSDLRDALFALMDSTSAPGLSAGNQNLSRGSLQLANANTLLFFSSRLDLEQIPESLAQLPQFPLLKEGRMAEFQAGLAAQEVTAKKIASLLGQQFTFLLNWEPQAMNPSLLLALDLKAPSQATQLLQLLTGGSLGNTPWEHTRKENAELFSIRPLPMIAPTFAVKEKNLMFSLDSDTINTALRPRSNALATTGSQRNNWFAQAEANSNPNTHSLGYIDSKQLFERVYSMSRPFIMLWGGLNPKVRNAVDLNRLPTTDCISRHLGPITFSSTWGPQGFFAQSRGPVTLPQAAMALGLGSGAALIPKLSPGKSEPGPSQGTSRGGQAEANDSPAIASP